MNGDDLSYMRYAGENAKGVSPDASVKELLRAIDHLLKNKLVTEIAINEPGRLFYMIGGEWIEEENENVTFIMCEQLATAVASYTDNQITPDNNILYAQLPSDERITIVVPPTVPNNTVSVTIRIPNSATITLDEYRAQGFFEKSHFYETKPAEDEDKLLPLLRNNQFEEFVVAAVQGRKNIAVIGDMGSGKTTFMKTLCQLIDPKERLITIEDTRELFLLNHRNKVHMKYSLYGKSKITPTQLIKCTLRQTPSRVLPAEVRGAEAFDLLDLLTAVPSGAITSFHAESLRVWVERYIMMCKKHPDAGSYSYDELQRLILMTIDVVVHVVREGDRRFIKEIYYDPSVKKSFAKR